MTEIKFTPGVSTASLYPRILEDAFLFLAENGVEATEIFINTECELSGVYLERVKTIINGTGIKVVSVHPFTCGLEPMMMYTEYERRMPDFLDFYSRYFEYMNAVGGEFFILHGNKPPAKIPETLEFDRFAQLASRAAQFGVTVVQENVSRCLSRDLGKLLRMKEYLGDLAAFVLDVKQARRSGYAPIDFVKALGGSIKHIHYSDAGAAGDCLFFGEGGGVCEGGGAENGGEDYAAFFREIHKIGYEGAVLLETYRDRGDPEYDRKLIENYKKMNNYLRKGEFLI
ncbi:MAG: sugar phosphate isomerase/epimerase [Ruminococcus sp.]|nr:sugar phosphate isomerase/epimerase [Ruminococcus sp.]